LITAYALFVAMVAFAWGRPVARPAPRPHGRAGGSARASLRRVVGTTVGGYVAFLAIVLIFHVWLARGPDTFASAVWGGAFLSGIAVVMAGGPALIGRRRRGRR
jgi:Family of unknown function (DUF6256)